MPSAPVWSLSVNLETKTAVFQSGLADAAKAARGSFSDIKSGASEMGREVGGNMRESRESVMLLAEGFGVHLPRGLTSFIASLGPIAGAMEAAFPFLAIVTGAVLLLEHLQKLKEEGERLTESQITFGTVTANVLNGLNDKLLQASIRADELNGDHLHALEKELALIDHQSMNELVQAFNSIAKGADAAFAEIKTHFYDFGSGAEGAKASLERFKTQYESLLAQRNDKGANDLLDATIQREERILELQKQFQANSPATAADGKGDRLKLREAEVELEKMGVGFTEKEVLAQERLVEALRAQVSAHQAMEELKAANKTNARTETTKAVDADSDKIFRAQAQERQREQEEQDKLDAERYKEAVDRIQQTEREKITATEQGSQARLNAIDAAIRDENSKGLQETGFYKELLTQRVDAAKQLDAETRKLQAQAGAESSAHQFKMDELGIQAKKESDALKISAMRNSLQAQLESEISAADADFKAKMAANSRDIAALDSHEREYENKLKALQDRQTELVQQHENQITAIKDKAEEQRNSRILSAEQHLNDSIAKNLTDTLMRHQTFSRMIVSLGDEVVSGMLQNALKSIMADDMTKEHDAAAAARKAYLAGMQFPFPVNIIMGPTLAAAAFASVMAFAEGGIVPGVGIGDVQPAMLEPGETVIPKKMTEQLTRASNSDSGTTQPPIHVHVHHNPTIHALDAESMGRVLQKNADVLTKHVEHTLRKMNR